MNYNKYHIGQKVLLYLMGNNWVNDIEIECVIVGFENYYNNGRAVYILKRNDGVIYNGIDEKFIKKL